MFKTYHLKIKNTDKSYFSRLFSEAKWYSNTIISSSDIFKFDTKSKIAFLTAEISEETKWLSSQMRQELKDRVISNLKVLAVRKRKGGKVGKLKVRKFVNSIPLKNQTLTFSGNRVRFQGSKKWFRVFGLEQLPKGYKLQSARLLRNALGIYLDLSVEIESEQKLVEEKEVIGVDFGIKDALVFSDGLELNTDFGDTEKRIKQAHKELSRKKKGSNRRQKARHRLAKIYQQLENQKQDVANKVLNKLGQFKVCYQDEMLSGWHRLFGKSVQKGILGRVKSGLKSNPENQVISRKEPTTQLCQECGALNKHGLKERVYRCNCGYSKPRDKHAAENMIRIGLGQAVVERGSDLWLIFSEIESKHLVMKREANVLLAVG